MIRTKSPVPRAGGDRASVFVQTGKPESAEVYAIPPGPQNHTLPADFDSQPWPMIARHWFGVAVASQGWVEGRKLLVGSLNGDLVMMQVRDAA